MKKNGRNGAAAPMRRAYDFQGGIRGKYATRFAHGTNLVRLEPDVARAFPTSTAVNRALRALAGTLRLAVHLPSR